MLGANLSKIKDRNNFFQEKNLVERLIQERGEKKDRGQEKRVKCELQVHKKPFRFLHDFILSHRFPEEQEKIEKNQRR
jgi:hypothetical protein